MIAVGFAMAWSCWTRLRGAASPTGDRIVDRSYFLALSALSMSVIFALLVLTTLAPRFVLSPCE